MKETAAGGRRVLYITYDGVADPLGRSQILPYLTGLSALGHEITILSCEKPDRLASDGSYIRNLCAAEGIIWKPILYHKRPPVLSTIYDQWRLRRTAFRLHRRAPFDIVHCRSYIPGEIGLAMKREFGTAFLFDMRGFWPDEKVEAGSWDLTSSLYGRVYRHVKRLEDQLFRGADHIISLTYEGKRQMMTRPQFQPNGPKITVIPCCADFGAFPLRDVALRAEGRSVLGLSPEAHVLGYLGSVGAWYMLDEMLDFFTIFARERSDPRFLFVTREPASMIAQAARDRGVDPERLIIRPASREEVPVFMAAVDLGISFIKPVFSKKASSPTKMGEMLALGLPLVTNDGVGDVGRIVRETDCGVAIDCFNEATYAAALKTLREMTIDPLETRRRASTWFNAENGIENYASVYDQLTLQL